MGMRGGDTYEELIQKFGDPSHLDRSKDELERVLSFEKYNVFFLLKQNRVVLYGIYNPTHGPMEFLETKKKIPKKSR